VMGIIWGFGMLLGMWVARSRWVMALGLVMESDRMSRG